MKTYGMKVIDNELYIGKFKASELARIFKTPLYVYDEENIRYKLNIYKNYFNSKKINCEVVYASKALLVPYMAKIIEEYNMSIDSIGVDDLELLENIRFPQNHIIVHGNNKSDDEIKKAILMNVEYLVVDNIDELQTLIEITNELKKHVNILLRINPGISAHTHEYIQTSLLSSKFGESIYDIEKIKKMISIVYNNPYITLDGFHIHIGSNINSALSFVSAVNVMIEFIDNITQLTGFVTKTLDLGGGFGIKYQDTDDEIVLQDILQKIVSTVENFVNEKNYPLEKLMIEPGRSIVGDSGSTLYTVGGIKETYGGKNYIFVDGGMADNIRPALYQAKYSADIVNRFNQEKTIPYDIAGKYCESGDIIINDIKFSDVRKNDILITYCTGAYGYSMASNYNGSPKLPIIFVKEDDFVVASHRETSKQIFDACSFSNAKIFDTHSDMLYDLYKNFNDKEHFNNYHVPQLLSSPIRGALWTMYSEYDFDLIDACKKALSLIDMKKLPNFKVILGLEGLRNLKKAEDIDILYNMGFRHAMLTWNEENIYATGAKSDPLRGLKDEGIKLLKRMEELDMIIDLAHLNEKSFYEVLEVANKNLIYSHGNTKALCDHVRNVTDNQMRALKAKDGLLGLTLANNFVSSDKKFQTLDKFIEHIYHAIDIMSIDNVCFGFDFMDYLTEFPNCNLECVNNASLAYRIVEGLRDKGMSEEDIEKICYKNFYNRFKDKIVLGENND